eukprot:SAG22_NODE_17147_length_310_cov_1.800948_1_plen_70_part_10
MCISVQKVYSHFRPELTQCMAARFRGQVFEDRQNHKHSFYSQYGTRILRIQVYTAVHICDFVEFDYLLIF